MKYKKVMVVFGTRPEAIKMAPILKEFLKYDNEFKIVTCVTAQHRQMLDQVLELFEIDPDYDLNIMAPHQDLFQITCKILNGIRTVIEKEIPDCVLVHGDTTTALASSLSSYYCKIPIGHIESGLRTFNKISPFPEEINRKLTDSLADLHFAPTKTAKDNLLREGISNETIYITGNTVVDALLAANNIIQSNKDIVASLHKKFSFLDPHKLLILVTGHRRENFGQNLEDICAALSDLARDNPQVEILYPVHLNPNVQEPVHRLLNNGLSPNVHLIEPLDYLPFVYIMSRSYFIITDSGGIQEEAPSLGKPVLVLRDVTERPEAVEAGTVKIIGTKRERIYSEATRLLTDATAYNAMAKAVNPYGDGRAAFRIVEALRARWAC